MPDVCALCGQGWCECGIETDATPLTLAAKLSALPLVPTPGMLRGILAHGDQFPSHQCLNCTARLPVCQHAFMPIHGNHCEWCSRCGTLKQGQAEWLPHNYVKCVGHARIYTKAETDAG
jgi:hypothetical protein